MEVLRSTLTTPAFIYEQAGFVYGKMLEETGWTGEQWTRGNGGYMCKDVLISVMVNIG
jgi:hypothetical protein